MIVNCLTTFPEFLGSLRSYSMIKRALDLKLLDLRIVNLRDFSLDPNRRTDDYPFGGGQGMLMSCQPIVDALESIERPGRVVYMGPRGKTLTQDKLKELASLDALTLLCGHYEGVDARVCEHYVDEEISIGDYVVTGGEIPCMLLIDGIIRLLPGLLRSHDSYEDESFYDGLLEYSQYTRPYDFRGYLVPDILRSGHHEMIRQFRRLDSLRITQQYRPDLFARYCEKYKEDREVAHLLQILRKEATHEPHSSD